MLDEEVLILIQAVFKVSKFEVKEAWSGMTLDEGGKERGIKRQNLTL